MKNNKHLFSVLIVLILVTSLLFPSKSIATSWAYSFVVWEGYIYVISDVYVGEIDSEIGHVTKYSDMESYSGNFSNSFKKGTKYYSIKGIRTDEAIAIEESDGLYIKAYREGEYGVRSPLDGYFEGQQGIIKIFVFLIIGMIAFIYINKGRVNNRRIR